MMNSTTRNWADVVREVLRLWVEDLQMAGHDLVAYGQAEMAAFRQARRLPLWRYCVKECYQQDGKWHSRMVRYAPMGFKYGPNPEDWDVLVDVSPADEDDTKPERSKDFVLKPERKQLMPGAWVDDEEDGGDEELEKEEEIHKGAGEEEGEEI
ncbi:hypothetical protein VTJ49DRAFT_2024 [Mycothermus thermophilus]|uniref:Uncharacterized protein n=1 Tax=Humicola insolens TaxID=85995 RepID=A0ABR3VAX3_HUMIN